MFSMVVSPDFGYTKLVSPRFVSAKFVPTGSSLHVLYGRLPRLRLNQARLPQVRLRKVRPLHFVSTMFSMAAPSLHLHLVDGLVSAAAPSARSLVGGPPPTPFSACCCTMAANAALSASPAFWSFGRPAACSAARFATFVGSGIRKKYIWGAGSIEIISSTKNEVPLRAFLLFCFSSCVPLSWLIC